VDENNHGPIQTPEVDDSGAEIKRHDIRSWPPILMMDDVAHARVTCVSFGLAGVSPPNGGPDITHGIMMIESNEIGLYVPLPLEQIDSTIDSLEKLRAEVAQAQAAQAGAAN
jgi:hypothetical protein